MSMNPSVDLDRLRPYLNLLNQVFEIEKKIGRLEDPGTIGRNVRRMKETFENDLGLGGGGFVYEDPTGEPYNETRADCDATIVGEGGDDLVVVETNKPIIRFTSNGITQIVQRAVVTVESRSTASPA